MFYHRTEASLYVGAILLPPAQTGTSSRWRHVPTYRDDRVYMYASPFDDSFDHDYMKHHGSRVYRVEPLTGLEPDSEGHHWVDRFMAESALVVHIVK